MYFSKFLKLSDVKHRFLKDRITLLKDIVKLTLVAFPFQNTQAFGIQKIGPKPTPTLKDVLDSYHRGHGGLCGHNNYGLKLILDSIGYQTYAMGAKFRRTAVVGSHVVCGVVIPARFTERRLEDEHYLVDVGCGVPLVEPIRIKSLPYHGRAGGLDFSYELSPCKKRVERVNRFGDAISGKKHEDFISPQDYDIDLEPRNISDIRVRWSHVFENVSTTALHKTFYFFRYLDILPDNSDFKLVCIRGKELMFVTKETRESTIFAAYEDLLPAIREYFPMVPEHDVHLAIRNFNTIEASDRAALKAN